MALSIKLDTDINPLLAVAITVGCKGWGQQLESCGVALEVLPKTLILRQKGAVLAQEVVNASAIKLLLQGNLQQASKMMLSEKLFGLYESAIKTLVATGELSNKIDPKTDLHGVKPNVAEEDPNMPEPGLSFHDDDEYGDDDAELLVQPTATAAPKDLNTANVAAKSLSTANPVKLSAATAIGQPVNATSAGSIYHVVALSSILKAGARLKVNGLNWSLAVRFEGVGLKTHSEMLKAIGANPGNGYFSLHLSGDGGSPMATRALGAVLLGLGLSWTSTMSPLQPLINAGA